MTRFIRALPRIRIAASFMILLSFSTIGFAQAGDRFADEKLENWLGEIEYNILNGIFYEEGLKIADKAVKRAEKKIPESRQVDRDFVKAFHKLALVNFTNLYGGMSDAEALMMLAKVRAFREIKMSALSPRQVGVLEILTDITEARVQLSLGHKERALELFNETIAGPKQREGGQTYIFSVESQRSYAEF